MVAYLRLPNQHVNKLLFTIKHEWVAQDFGKVGAL
jgi:hypothetical protein